MNLRAYGRQLARRYGIPPAVFEALIAHESGWNPSAVSPAGAIGLGQLMPGTARGLGVDPHDPRQNLEGAARYLSMQLKRFGNLRLALAAYNAGPGAVQSGAWKTYPETVRYVSGILGSVKNYRPEGGDASAKAGNFSHSPGLPVRSGASSPDLASAAFSNLSEIATTGKLSPFRGLESLSQALAAGGGPSGPPAAPAAQGPVQQFKGTLPFTGKTLKGVDPGFASKVFAAAKAAGATKLRFSSAYRSPSNNAAVGGVSNSNHTYGHAFDGEAYIPGRGWIPLGDLPTLRQYGLRSGDQPGFYRGGRDPVHVDDAYNLRHRR